MAPVVPIIDMSDFEARRDEVTAQLMEAAEKIGFFQVNAAAGLNTPAAPRQGVALALRRLHQQSTPNAALR